jgi:hypothetical protein
MVKPWMLDELAHAGPEHLDPGFVAGFDRKQGYPDFADDLAVLADHGIGSANTLVDLGAGTGRFALAAAPRVRRVIAVDVSPAMQACAPRPIVRPRCRPCAVAAAPLAMSTSSPGLGAAQTGDGTTCQPRYRHWDTQPPGRSQ